MAGERELMPKRRRKADPRKRIKRTDVVRTCPSGKRGWRHEGEARAFIDDNPPKRGHLRAYLCATCKDYHVGNPIPRRVRQREAAEGKVPQ